MTAPGQPGIYEIRLLANAGFVRLATSAPVRVSTQVDSCSFLTARLAAPYCGPYRMLDLESVPGVPPS